MFGKKRKKIKLTPKKKMKLILLFSFYFSYLQVLQDAALVGKN